MITNTIKDTKGILKFQVIQNSINTIHIRAIVDKKIYTKKIENIFIENWRKRVGGQMDINIEYVKFIPNEKSGKYSFVKNKIKHLINN
jgi:phenylacetate-CoA ligase